MPLVFPIPPISTLYSHLLIFLFAFSYVGSLYVSKFTRLSFSSRARPSFNGDSREKESYERWRDDPDVIKARLVAVTIATSVNCAGVFTVLWHLVGSGVNRFETAFEMAITRLGFLPNLDLNILYPHLITPLLFLGPLYAEFLGGTLPTQKFWSFKRSVVERFGTWQGVRNYVMAPITEELVFRACVLSVYHLSGASRARMIFLGPLSFGLAHVHHAWDTYNRYGRTTSAAKRAIFTSLFQLAYTTLFGFHCSYLFLRTGSIYPPITAHIFCNIMGLPQISWELRKFPHRKIAIITAYIIGIIGFAYALRPWTKTEGSLYWRDNINLAGHATY